MKEENNWTNTIEKEEHIFGGGILVAGFIIKRNLKIPAEFEVSSEEYPKRKFKVKIYENWKRGSEPHNSKWMEKNHNYKSIQFIGCRLARAQQKWQLFTG